VEKPLPLKPMSAVWTRVWSVPGFSEGILFWISLQASRSRPIHSEILSFLSRDRWDPSRFRPKSGDSLHNRLPPGSIPPISLHYHPPVPGDEIPRRANQSWSLSRSTVLVWSTSPGYATPTVAVPSQFPSSVFCSLLLSRDSDLESRQPFSFFKPAATFTVHVEGFWPFFPSLRRHRGHPIWHWLLVLLPYSRLRPCSYGLPQAATTQIYFSPVVVVGCWPPHSPHEVTVLEPLC